MYQFKVAKWGNSLAVRLPRGLVKDLGIEVGDRISSDLITNGAALAAALDAAREAKRMTREESTAAIRAGRKDFAQNLEPEEWKIDRSSTDARG